MARRALFGAFLLASWLGGTILGIAFAALRTGHGREVVVTWAVRAANQRIAGSIGIGAVGGSFLGGLRMTEVVLRDAGGNVVLTSDTLGLQFRIRDLLRRRLTFGALTVVGPDLDLVQWAPGERWNIERVFGGGRPGGRGSERPVAFSDVVVRRASVLVRSPAGPGDSTAVEVVPGRGGPLRVRRFAPLDLRVPYLRIGGSDAPAPVIADVAELALAVSDPAVRVTGASGRILVWRDSVGLSMSSLRFPATETSLEGSVAWHGEGLWLDLRGEAREAVTDDVRALVAGLPPGLTGSVTYAVRSEPGDVVRVTAAPIALRGRVDGGSLRGRLGMTFGPGKRWGFENTALDLDRFDLEHVRGYLDTLPVAGTYTGTLAMAGRAEELHVAFEGVFRDTLVEGFPESSARGEGVLVLGTADGLTFRAFELAEADVALGTVTRLVPAMVLRGRLSGHGSLDGVWRAATFTGAMRYRDGAGPETRAAGILQLDARRDTLGVWGDLAFDSLDLASFHGSFPGFATTGRWAGTAQLAGWLDSLAVSGALSGPAGDVEVHGALRMLPDERGMIGMQVTFAALDLSLLDARSPATGLVGTLDLEGTVWPAERRSLGLDLALGRSTARDVPLDSAAARGVLRADEAVLDGVRAWSGRSWLAVDGGVGLTSSERDTLRFELALRNLAPAEPFLRERLGPVEIREGAPLPSGTAHVVGRLQGPADARLLVVDWDVPSVRRGALYVTGAGGTATWVSATRTLRASGRVDSLEVGGRGFAAGRVEMVGRSDSVAWQGRSNFGSWAAWIGGGRLVAEGTTRLATLDSLNLLLGMEVWRARPGAVVALDDSGTTITDLEFRHGRSAARMAWDGRLPFRGAAGMTASIEGFPLQGLMLLLQQDHDGVEGEVSGRARLGGTARAPELAVDLNVDRGRFGAYDLPYVEATLNYAAQRLSGVARLFRSGEPILDVDLELPMDLALAGATRRRLPGPIRVHATAAGADLSLLEPTIPVARDVRGTLDADFGIEGTWEQPELAGRITVRDGAATFPALGVRHEALNGVLTLSGDTIHVERLTMRSGTGTGTIHGFVRLEELARPLLQLEATATDFRAIDVPGFLSLTTSADVALRGPFYGATLTGQATATRGTLYFADLLTKDIVNLQDTLFAEFVDTALVRRQGLGAALQNRFLDSLRIDSLRVNVGSEFWMRSSEANIQLAGSVFANKLGDQYRLDGTLQAPRGTYRLRLGFTTREFAVTGGTVRYLGTPDLNADLDIRAEHVVRTMRREDVTVLVTIGGTVYEPQLTLTSSVRPALSETEIISYLLFGAPSVQAGAVATGFESRIVSQQILGALSSQLEYSLISNLGVPLDYVQIRPVTAGTLTGWELAAGKQISLLGTTAFLSASPQICLQGSTAGQQFEHWGASLEFRLSRRWLLTASVDPVRGCEAALTVQDVRHQLGVDLFWETSY